MSELLSYTVDGKEYQVEITRKWMRTIQYRFRDGIFKISAPRLVSKTTILAGLEKFARGLIKRSEKVPAITDEYIYILGKKIELTYPGYLALDSDLISYKDNKQLHSKLKKWFLDYLTKRTAFFEQVMNAPHYSVKVRQMKSRYGSNNKSTKTITYSLVLIHYSPEIIDSVIIHELAHCFAYNHGDNFYKVVAKARSACALPRQLEKVFLCAQVPRFGGPHCRWPCRMHYRERT